jgi:hypothetical protein
MTDTTLRLNAHGVAQLEEIARAYGATAREYLEALMHFAISCERRPGSWEAQGFYFSAYDPRNEHAHADRWF